MDGQTDPDRTPIVTPPRGIDRALVVRAYGLTDRGQVRERNEDQFLVAELTRAMRVLGASLAQPSTLFADERATLLVVADGMGGHKAGQEASALAVATLEDFLLNAFQFVVRLQGDAVVNEFQDALRAADARIFDRATRHPEMQGMGTTLTLAYAVRSTLWVVHVGDSRCYLYRDGRLHQLTRDHTLVAEMVQKGILEPAQAEHHALRNVITNAVGGTEPGISVEVHRMQLDPNDVVLLCSDGLSEMLDDPQIAAVLAAERDPQPACAALVNAANQAGGKDNITAVVARFDASRPDDV
jgi:protein phosphatase